MREELAPVRECFEDRASLDAAFGYYRTLTVGAQPHLKKLIRVPTVVFAGTDDPNVFPEDYRRAARMFANGYVIEQVPGGHFLHREHPELVAERLLAHL